MGSFQGSPVLCFFNERLFEATVRTNDMLADSGFLYWDRIRFYHESSSSFLRRSSTILNLLSLFSE